MPPGSFPMSTSKPRAEKTRFQQSLVRNTLAALLLISLFPFLVIGTLNIFRGRTLLRGQASQQLESISNFETNQIDQFVRLREELINSQAADEVFTGYIQTLADNKPGSADHLQASYTLSRILKTNQGIDNDALFNQVVIIRPNGEVLISTSDLWVMENFGSHTINDPAILDMVGTNQSVFIFNPLPSYHNHLALFITRSYFDQTGVLLATQVNISISAFSSQVLNDPGTFLKGAKSYYFLPDGNLVSTGDWGTLRPVSESAGIQPLLAPLVGNVPAQTNINALAFGKEQIIGTARWLPKYNVGLLLTVPLTTVYAQNNLLDPLNLVLLAVSLLVSGGLIYFGSTGIVNPLVELSRAVNDFSKGNWKARAGIRRSDEIGLLAYSFNKMADDLSEMYSSLEAVVEKRTSQLRIASEVAQLATSTTRLQDTLSRTSGLIAERFSFHHVAIYLTGVGGQTLELKEASGPASQRFKARGAQVQIDETSLIGWAAVNHHARIIHDTANDPLFRPDSLLPGTQAEVAVPIMAGNAVLGVIDIQSADVEAFDDETISVFQTLANQVSGTIQNARTLESTQLSFQETALLYRLTRQVTQARSEDEIIDHLSTVFAQLPLICAIFTVEYDQVRILAVTDPDNKQVDLGLKALRMPATRMVRLLEEQRIVQISDITQPSDYETLLSFLIRRGCRSGACIGVLEDGHLSKIIALGSLEANRISGAALQPYANLAEVVGASLVKLRVLASLQARLAELQTLTSFSRSISAEIELGALYKALHQQVVETFGSDLDFMVALYQPENQTIRFPYVIEKDEPMEIPPIKLGEGLTSKIIHTQRPLALNTQREIRAHSPVIVGDAPMSWLGIPLIFAGKVVGAIIVQDLNNENRFSQDDVDLFLTLAPQIATAVRNTQLYDEAQEALKAYDQEHFLINNLLQAMPEAIAFKDREGRYIRVSASMARELGRNPRDFIGKTDKDLRDPENAKHTIEEDHAVLESGQPIIGKIDHEITANRQDRWIHSSRIPIYAANGEIYGLLIIQRDITTLKQAEGLAQQRAEQVLTAAEIARDVTGTLDMDMLLGKAVNLVRERFGFSHASVFLLDSFGEYAVLRESTGEAGRQMLNNGHRLAVGSKSIVGQVTARGEAVIVNDVRSDRTFFPNPLLPETRSEMAIPLKVGDRTLGALDVQSNHLDAFKEEDIGVLHILADQLAIALANGDLYGKTQELLGKHRLLRQISIAASASTDLEDALANVVGGLRTAMVADRVAVLLSDEQGSLKIRATSGYENADSLENRLRNGYGITRQAALEQRPIRVDDTQTDPRYIRIDPQVSSELAVPILFSDALIGVLNLESNRISAFDENDQEILGALGNNLGGVISNLRLVNQVREQVQRERQLFDVTSKIRRTVDLEAILETSTQEICRALGARRARVEITAKRPEQEEETPWADILEQNNGHEEEL